MSKQASDLFGRLRVMEPRLLRDPPTAAEGTVAQLKWDGVRMLVFVEPERVRLQNRHLRDRGRVYPEFDGLQGQLSYLPLVLDGEVVQFVDERPSFSAVLKRELATADGAQVALERHGPVTYCVFDVLYAGGQDLRAEPWEERDRILVGLWESAGRPSRTPGGCNLHKTQSFSDVSALVDSTRELGLEGVVIKRVDAPYVAGKKHSSWFKFKHRQNVLAQVVGFRANGPFVTSLYLGVLSDGQLRYIGSAGSGLSREVSGFLFGELSGDITAEPVLAVPRAVLREATWVRPRLVVRVEFLEWTPEGQLRHPVVVDFPTVKLSDCTIAGTVGGTLHEPSPASGDSPGGSGPDLR